VVQLHIEAAESKGQPLDYLLKKYIFSVLRRFHSTEQNIVKFNKQLWFFKFIISVKGGHCDTRLGCR
jgi:hypothetical protein